MSESTREASVCPECLTHRHKDCAGLIEADSRKPWFCECPVCTLRFNRNLRRLLSGPGFQEKRADA